MRCHASMIPFFLLRAALCLSVSALACSDLGGVYLDAGRIPGTEGGSCKGDGTCNKGLLCKNDICIRIKGDGGSVDGSPKGDTLTPDTLKPDIRKPKTCDQVGEPCLSSDPCAIVSICNQDRFCTATKVQNCDDGQSCTNDTCLGLGICMNIPKSGSCLIQSKTTGKLSCVKKGDQPKDNQCMICDDTVDPYIWTVLSGFSCDDGDSCTKNDRCVFGVCAGTSFADQCADEYSCTEDLCDGSGGCKGNTLKSGWCLIDKICYKDEETDATGCKICDSKKSTSSWTPVPTKCLIKGQCYRPNTLQPLGCGICDPKTSTTDWTPMGSSTCSISGACYPPNRNDTTGCATCDPEISSTTWSVPGTFCVINRTCYTPKAAHSNGCATCAPTRSKITWSPDAGKCLIGGTCYSDKQDHTSKCLVCDASSEPSAWSAKPSTGSKVTVYSFEEGSLPGWTIENSASEVGWLVSDKRSSGGGYALYYGNGIAANYITNGPNSGTATLPPYTITPGKTAGLSLMIWVDTESGKTYDQLAIRVNGKAVWVKNAIPMRTWKEIYIPLSGFGPTATIQFSFNTIDGGLNASEGIYIDEITIFHDCTLS